MNQQNDLPNDVVQIQAHALRIGFLGERAKPQDHLARAHPVIDHALHGTTCLIQLRRIPAEPPKASRAVGDDAGERLVHFVGD